MSTNIFYDNIDFFSQNDLPTPRFSVSNVTQNFNNSQSLFNEIKLTGDIYIKNKQSCNLLQQLEEKRDLLISFFSTNFVPIKIIENSNVIFERDFCKVTSIDFPDSNYISILNYTITISAYDEKNNTGAFAVTEPRKSINISRLKNNNYKVSRSISAIGLNTQDGNLSGSNVGPISSSLQNAIDFVNSFDVVDDISFYLDSGFKFYRENKSESINRLTNKYSIDEEYILTKNEDVDEGVLSYTISRDKSFAATETINMKGEIRGGENVEFDKIKQSFKKLDIISLIEQKTGIVGLNKFPSSVNISEIKESNLINFDYRFGLEDGQTESSVKLKMNYDIQDNDSDIDVILSGSINSDAVKINRWKVVSDYFNNLQYDTSKYDSWFHEKTQEKINEFYNLNNSTETSKTYVLKSLESSKSISFDELSGVIEFNLSFSSKNKSESFTVYEMQTSVKLHNELFKFHINHGYDSERYIISNDGKSKAEVSISISAEYNGINKNEAKLKIDSEVNNKINSIKSDFFQNDIVIESSKSRSIDFYKNVISCNYSYNIYES